MSVELGLMLAISAGEGVGIGKLTWRCRALRVLAVTRYNVLLPVATVLATLTFGSALLASTAPMTTAAEGSASGPVTSSPGEMESHVAIEGRCPTFSWGSFESGMAFQLSVYAVDEDGEAQARPTLQRTFPPQVLSWTPPSQACLLAGRYAWAVRAQTALGWSAWSQPRLFEVRPTGAAAADPEFRQAVIEVAQWLRDSQAVPQRKGHESSNVKGAYSDAGIANRRADPLTFTPAPCQSGSEVFSDVAATNPLCAFIQQVFRDGIAQACAANPVRYCPDAPVTRAQMAAFLERTLYARLPEIDAGGAHTCGLLSNRTLVCWGANDFNMSLPPAGTFKQVAAGDSHTCGLKSDGTVACWGSNGALQSLPPVGTFTQITTGAVHTCGVKSDGTVACWGSNALLQSTPPAGTFTHVSGGSDHTCGIRSDGTVACWGSNGDGQSAPPAGIFTQISAGWLHTCGMKSDGPLMCWGSNASGQSTPPALTFTQVSAGSAHSCGVKSDGTVACWGSNASSQLTPPSRFP